eukprot:SAG31_NODE_1791_length_7258_cov_12.040928_4_plen_190_part_00
MRCGTATDGTLPWRVRPLSEANDAVFLNCPVFASDVVAVHQAVAHRRYLNCHSEEISFSIDPPVALSSETSQQHRNVGIVDGFGVNQNTRNITHTKTQLVISCCSISLCNMMQMLDTRTTIRIQIHFIAPVSVRRKQELQILNVHLQMLAVETLAEILYEFSFSPSRHQSYHHKLCTRPVREVQSAFVP